MQRIGLFFLATGLFLPLIVGAAPPSAITGTVSNVESDSATLNGTETIVVFEYGPTSAYGNTVTANESPLPGSTEQSVSAEIGGLEPETTYHFRVTASNENGQDAGEDETFSTAALIDLIFQDRFEM